MPSGLQAAMQAHSQRTQSGSNAKLDLRKAVLARRNALRPDEIARKSEVAAEHFFALPGFAGAHVIMFFISFGSEIHTLPMVRRALGQGKRVVAPRADHKTRYLMPCEVTNPDLDLAPGAHGILEPTAGCAEVAPDSIDVVIVPGAVWAEDGYRLGYGAGYYDRFLARAPRACRVGLGLEVQVVPVVPHDGHDLPVDLLVTEARVRKFAHRSCDYA